jgi:hypothetical protein
MLARIFHRELVQRLNVVRTVLIYRGGAGIGIILRVAEARGWV